MNAKELTSQVVDALEARRVFGEAYEKDGLTIIPVAALRSGWGGGGEADQSAWGLGAGLSARPVGVVVVKGDAVTWQPTIDVNRMVLVGQLIALVAIMTLGATVRSLTRRKS